jgi:antitoxin ParD1/3/4
MTTKVAISLPDDVLASARQAVADGRASSLSGYISSTLAERQDYEDLAELLAEMAAETGGPSDEDRRWARQALGLDRCQA